MDYFFLNLTVFHIFRVKKCSDLREVVNAFLGAGCPGLRRQGVRYCISFTEQFNPGGSIEASFIRSISDALLRSTLASTYMALKLHGQVEIILFGLTVLLLQPSTRGSLPPEFLCPSLTLRSFAGVLSAAVVTVPRCITEWSTETAMVLFLWLVNPFTLGILTFDASYHTCSSLCAKTNQ